MLLTRFGIVILPVEASVEGKSSNASNSIRNRDVRQVGALRECISPDVVTLSGMVMFVRLVQ